MLTASSYFNQNPFTSSTGDTSNWNKFGQDSGYTSGFKFDSPNYSDTFKSKPDPQSWLKAYTQNMDLGEENRDKYTKGFTSNQTQQNSEQQNQSTGGQQFGEGGGFSGGMSKALDNLSIYQPPQMNPFTVAGMPGQPGKPGLVQQLSPLLGLIPGVGPALAFGVGAVSRYANV